ncbi:carbohydate-binding domain-containing protein [Shewanella oneidensis MR-1]|uniref:beta-N-acetylhexosaminidase n=1 Tax=Shewanella oneidensis (strain ATCC 700550 / JCM 31522 / CIP 106686 / LMG 19005 / NCIMB 14063 / MR-1) TaxID=211586 RepID=Q8CVD2_SHEON|nr:family 20 glycosylhydrolase [Shewanella oneidensis]AAN56500.1 beta-N-acetylhexosaminidase HexB [Shewanella oneidensis MR-1]MDX5999095.1 family 20 glycosylhydrolase [Shewanella oneidensis]MEE2029578.1 N,N'-diacetylchitobiase [Shewanella oneidensis]QKG97883.1 carbohydate-binding domain-containing protein [Shewanella oneidensis MR-1]
MSKTIAATAILFALGLSACSQGPKTVNTPAPSSAEQPTPALLTQAQLQQFGDNLGVTYRVLTNRPDDNCDKAAAEGRCFVAEIDFVPEVDLIGKEWAIYFSQMRPVQSVEGKEFSITHIKGDLYRIAPTEAFSGFSKGVKKTLRFRGELWQLSETDAMPNYYIVAGDLSPVVIASTQVKQDPETRMEVRPYVEPFTDMVKQYSRTDADKLAPATASQLFSNNQNVSEDASLAVNTIIPTPKTVVLHSNDKVVSLSSGIKLDVASVSSPSAEKQSFKTDQVAAALERLARLGVKESEQGLVMKLSWRQGAEGSYLLDIKPDGIKIAAGDAAGFSYALSSLTSLIDVQDLRVNAMTIEDSPRYPFRGMHIDVARNFHSKAMIFALIDQMAAYKLNKLHLHMADDEGWRLEIDGLPELTDIGSKRCHDLEENTCLLPQLGSGPFAESSVNGFYSKQDYIDILKYANARQIQVIPSMDMPGHSRAAIKSMEARYRKLLAQGKPTEAKTYLLSDAADTTVYSSVQYYNDNTLNVCMESTYQFVDKVIDEIAKLHQAAGQPLTRYHIGADETAGAWKQSPECLSFVANNDKGVKSIEDLGAYFIERISNQLAEKGIEAAGWSDGMSHVRPSYMPAKVQSNIWDVIAYKGYEHANQQVNNGWDVVLSNPEVLYFDFPYEADPKEHGYYWASRATNAHKVFSFMPDNLVANAEQWTDLQNLPFEADDRARTDEKGKKSGPREQGKNFAGLQGQLWSETIRSNDTVEYMIFPRLLMLAERAWHQAEWEVPYQYQGALYNQSTGHFTAAMRDAQAQSWQQMANTLGHKEFIKLDKAGIDYRVPTVGAKIQGGKLFANVAYPGLKMEFRQANGQWQAYQAGQAVTAPVEIRAIAADGIRKGRSLIVN